jgi:hypothetical protein
LCFVVFFVAVAAGRVIKRQNATVSKVSLRIGSNLLSL